MKHKLYTEVELKTDLPKYGLKAGDVVKLIDYSGENCVLEAFNVLGETLCVFVLPENFIKKLNKNKIFSARNLETI
jgi:hypothetical protein